MAATKKPKRVYRKTRSFPTDFQPGNSAHKPHDYDEALIADLAKIHCTIDEISRIVGCSTETLETRFLPLIKKNQADGKMSLRRAQIKMFEAGNATMAIWIGKQWLEQKDKVETSVDPSQFSESDLDARIRAKLDQLNDIK